LPGYYNGTVLVQSAGTLAARVAGPNGWGSADIASLLAASNVTFAAGAGLGIDTGSDALFIYDQTVATAVSGLPGPLGLAILGGGTVQLGENATIPGSLAVLGGTLDLNGYNPTAGTVTVDGASIVDSSGGNGSLTSNGFTLTNATIAAQLFDWTGTDTLSGTVDFELNVLPYNDAYVCFNAGEITTGSTVVVDGTAWNNAVANFGAMTNYGSIEVADGAQLCDDGTLTNAASGAITIDDGGQFYLDYTCVLDNYGTIVNNGSCNGFYDWRGYVANEAGASFANNGQVYLLGSTFANAGTLTNEGEMDTYACQIANSGTFLNDHGGTLSLTGSSYPSCCGITNSGSLTNNGTLNVGECATVDNAGTLTAATGGSIAVAAGGTLDNEGTLNDGMAALGTTGADNIVNNGTLVIDGSCTQTLDCALGGTGNLVVAAGATFDVAGANLTFNLVTVDGGSVVDSSGGDGSITANGFTITNATIAASITDSTGTDTISGAVTFVMNDTEAACFNNGTISLGSSILVTGGEYDGGGVANFGSMTNYGSIEIGAYDIFLDGDTFTNAASGNITIDNGGQLCVSIGCTLENYGAITNNGSSGWPDGCGFFPWGGAVVNEAGATFTNNGTAYLWGGTFDNVGTFDNEGVVNTLCCQIVNSGAFRNDYGSTLTLTGSSYGSGYGITNSGLLWNNGVLSVGQYTTLNNDAGDGLGIGSYGTITVYGAFNNDAGGYSTVNSLIIEPGGTMTLQNGSVLADWGTVAVDGKLTVDSSSTIYEMGTMTIGSGGELANGGLFDVGYAGMGAGTVNNSGDLVNTGEVNVSGDGSASVLNNYGTLDTSAVDAVFNNYGNGTVNDYASRGARLLGSVTGPGSLNYC
jgi:hypothetical protein